MTAGPETPPFDLSRLDALIAWMLDGARPSAQARQIIDRMCSELRAGGVPVDRFALFIFTLHPLVRGRRFVWRPDEGVAVSDATHTAAATPEFQATIARQVMISGEGQRCRLEGRDRDVGFADVDDLRREGATDYLISPLVFTTGETHAASWTTWAPGGFSDDALGALTRLRPALARLVETYTLRLNAANLLSAYIGRDAGGRILSGRIERGNLETFDAVIAFIDLKGYTRLSNEASPAAVIEHLNCFYDAVVPAIEDRGGEVLKFLGDGLIAIFPSEVGPDGAVASLSALAESQRRIGAANKALELEDRPAIAARASLHVGTVQFGNVGARHRLDFTAIGPAVNLGARLLGVAASEDVELVCSETFAALVPGEKRSLGRFSLKGFEQPVPVFTVDYRLA